MNIDLRKAEIVKGLDDLKKECEMLLGRIDEYRDEILKVQTEKETVEFDETHDIEAGLKIIRFF